MNLLVTLNDRYVRPLLVMLDSCFQYNDASDITVYLLHSGLSKTSLRRIKKKIHSYGGRFRAVVVGEEEFSEGPVFRYFTKEMYYRLLCYKYLPITEKRVLYLDPDILIQGSLLPLYHSDLHGKTIGAVSDYAVNNLLVECKEKIGIPQTVSYVNSGVLLFDLEKMRQELSMERMYAILEEKKDVFSFPDQDLINLYFKGDIHYLERTYNYNSGYGDTKSMLRYWGTLYSKKNVPVVIHFMGASKPWMPEYYGKFAERYLPYLKPYLSGKERIRFTFRYVYRIKSLLKAVARKIQE